MFTGEGSIDKIRIGKRAGKLCCLCWGLFPANSIIWTEVNTGTTSRLQWKKSHRQTISRRDLFCIPISENRNGLDSTVEFRCNRKKQYKCLINHHFPFHVFQQTKHHSGDPRYAAFKWHSINFQWVLGMQLIGGGGGVKQRSWKFWIYLGMYLKKTFTKIESYTGMAERPVRYLAIEEALQTEVKKTLEHNNQSYVDWCDLSDKG